MGKTTGNEPLLGGEAAQNQGGHDAPMLGGARRAPIDAARLARLTQPAAENTRLISEIKGRGQAADYAAALLSLLDNPRKGDAERARAVLAAAALAGPSLMTALLPALSDAGHEVRMAARTALNRLMQALTPADEALLHTFFAALAQQPAPARRAALQALILAPRQPALRLLVKRGLAHSEAPVRRDCCWMLGELGDVRATRGLLTALSDESGSVRAGAAWALGRWQAPICVPPLEALATTDPDENVRAAALGALGAQAAYLVDWIAEHKRLVALLAAHLTDDASPVRLAAYEALAHINSLEARQALKNAASRLKTS